MKKNITLTADEELIRKARERAQQECFSLNELFQNWLKQYVQQERAKENYIELMENLSYAESGKNFSREELNER
jgi:acyl-CoA-binding protein